MTRLKVLYINPPKDFGGATNSLLDIINGSRDIIEPIVLVPAEGDMSHECERIGVKCLIHSFTDLIVLQSYGKRHVLKHPLDSRLARYIMQDLKCLLYVQKQIKKGEIDVVHTNSSSCTVGNLIAKVYGVPHIWHVREALDLHFHANVFLGLKRLKKLINAADARIATSRAIASHWEMKQGNTFVLNDAVRKAEDAIYNPDKEKYILFASCGLTEAKGANLTVEAFGKSKLCNDGFKLKMVGGCSDSNKTKLLKIADNYQCVDSIEFIPFQQDVKPYFEKASAFIQGSVFEGLGRTTVESMFFGCPVIATAYSGGTLDVVKDKENGYLFNNVDECAELMRKVCLTDQTKIIENAQRDAITRFTPDAYIPLLIDVYKKVLRN